jgi:hypothetical protein
MVKLETAKNNSTNFLINRDLFPAQPSVLNWSKLA